MSILDLNKSYNDTERGKLRNNTTKALRTLQNNSIDRTNATQRDYQLYTSDPEGNTGGGNDYAKYIGAPNPLYEAFKVSDGQIADQSEHVYEYINKFKVADIAIGSAGGSSIMGLGSSSWGTWRTDNPAKIRVSPLILLFPSEKSFSFSYNHKYESAWMGLSNGLLSKISQAAEMARNVAALAGKTGGEVAGRFIPKYVNAPSYQSTSPLKLSSSLKFEFKFGQAGIYSGEEEVVRPILALASLYAPLGDTYVRGPAPTKPAFLVNFIGGAANALSEGGGIGNAIKELADGGFEDLIGNVTRAEKAIIRLQVNAIQRTLDESSRALYLRMGRMSWGPAIVGNVDWSFNFEQVDEFGFPYQGEITFGNLESALLPTPNTFVTMFNGTTGGNANTAGEANMNDGEAE